MTERELFKILNYISEKKLREEILEKGELLTFNKGKTIVREGEYVKLLPIVLSGQIRVFQKNIDREILLYYVNPSQTCMMSLSACFFNNESPSQAVTTEKTTILAIPTSLITVWQRTYPSWNKFVIRTFRNRYDELLLTFESVAFKHIDKRVWTYLKQRKEKGGTSKINISHQQLANELGTTRVVISRILKQFEIEGKLKLHRGIIEIVI